MKKLLLLLVVLLIAAALFALWPLFAPLGVTRFSSAAELLRYVPPDREAWLIPKVASTWTVAENHPVVAPALSSLVEWKPSLAELLLIGNADVLLWSDARGEPQFVVRTDPLRRLLVKSASSAGLLIPLRSDGCCLVSPAVQQAPVGDVLPRHGAATGHLFLIRPPAADSRLLPLAGVAAITLEERTLRAVAGIDRVSPAAAITLPPQHPRDALMSAYTAATPETLRRMERTLPIRVSSLLDRGAHFVIYEIRTERMFPRPYGLVAIAADAARAAELRAIVDRATVPRGLDILFGSSPVARRAVGGVEVVRRESLAWTIEYASPPGEFLLAFDKSSIERYLTRDPATDVKPPERGVVEWSVSARPQELLAKLDEVRRHRGVALISSELHEGADRLYRRLELLRGADILVAAQRSVGGQVQIEVVASAERRSDE